jgi:ArsR family transcriptional regulator, arsenate/arsenite/antimonite-responsive transcriptional repressor
MKALLKSLKALADGNRLRILRLLMDRPRCVCELQAALEITQPSVSKHLRILEEAGLVDKKRQGQFIDYHLATTPTPEDYQAALMALLGPWLREDPGLAAFSRQARDLNRQTLCRPAGRIIDSSPETELAKAEGKIQIKN